MDRERNCREGREVRRTSMAAGNGLTRRRPRTTTTTSFRDSPEEDGAMEMQETTRLRDRGSSKKERDHRLSRNKRRRADRFMHGTTNRDRVGDDTSEDSLDDDEEEDEDDEPGPVPVPVPVRMPPPNPNPNPNPNPSSSSITNHHHHRKNNFQHVGTKVVRAAPWKVTDEMGFSVPKKARSASAKRSHECWVSGGGTGGSSGGGGGGGGGGGEQLHRQASTSPARPPPSVAVSLPAPASPSSSSVSHKKKLKPLGHKLKPPKVSKPSSVQDEIEIEVAEVLYGLMRQSSRQESTSSSQKLDSTRDLNGSSTDAKSRVSSPVSNSPSLAIQQSKLPQNPSSSTTPSSAIAPKRKRPRVLRQEEESSTTKIEDSSPKLEKSSGSTLENNGGTPTYPGSSQTSAIVSEPPRESAKAESSTNSDSKPLNEELEIRDGVRSKEGVSLPREESISCGNKDVAAEKATAATKAISAAPDVVDNRREKSFKIDLMVPPLKSTQDGDGVIDFVSDAKAMVSDAEMKVEIGVKKEEKVNKMREHVSGETGMLGKKVGPVVNECELQKPSASQQGRLGLQIDLEKQNKDLNEPITTTSENKVQQLQKQQQQCRVPIESKPEKDVQSTSMHLPMTAAGWPGGLTPLGCGVGQVRPQGVASLDGNPGPSNAIQQPQFVLNQPRPKRCTTHYYIARNIYYHQQFTRMNPFWPAAAGAASIYGMKSPYNLNVLPPSEATIMGNPLQGNFVSRNMNSTQDKGLVEAVKDKGIMASNYMDATQKKQLVLQQAPPQMHAPAFIFHLSQQQAAAVAGNKSGSVKSQTAGNPSSSTTAQAAGAATTLSFNYQGLPSNDGQYLAILQNNGYPFPVGAPPHFRGATPSQAMPFLNGSFYPSQILHPSQFQQQQQLQSQSQQQAGQQGHQNGSTSSGSSSSQKHQQNQQQRLHGGGSSGSNAAGGNSNSLPGSKNRSTQPQSSSIPLNHQVRHLEADVIVEESPLTEDSRVSQGQKAAYNFSMQAQQKSLSAMSAALASGGTGNHGDKQQQSQHNSKGGPELISAQAFTMPFGPFNGAAAIPGFDMQNHVIFQNLPEAVRHGYPQMAAAVAAAQASQQQKRAHQYTGETKTVSDSTSVDDEKKAVTAKGTFNVGQGLVFSRADSTEQSTNLGSSVIESSAHTLNLISGPSNVNQTSRASMSTGAVMAGASAPGNTSNSQQQQQQQHQQLIHLQKHQQQQLHQHQQLQQQQQFHQQQLQHQLAAAAVARSKPSNTTSLSPYTDRLSTSSMSGKLPNSLSVFPQVLVQGGSSAQSPQWKNSSRTTVSSGSSPGPVSSTSSLKNHHSQQQQGRPQQGHTQISFGVNNLKQGPASHRQQIPSSNQSSSPPRSISKSAGGSPKTTSTGSKVGPAPALSSQQATKSSSSGPSRKSSPVGGMNAPSILGNSHVTSAPSSNAKPQSQQQQQQQQKQFQQAQLYFANPFMQAQSPQSTSTTTAASGASTIGYYQQRRPSEQLPQQGTSNASSGMISLSPSLTLAGVTTSDPTKAVAAAAANMKGGVLPPPGLLQASQFATQSGGHPFMSFPYIQSVPPQQVKPAEQKQPAGNDNLHACWQPEKR